MTSSEILSSLEVALGGHCPAPRSLSASRLLEIPVSGAVFEKLLRHWADLPPGSRPRLRGLTVSRGEPPSRQYLLEIGGRTPLLLVTVEPGWAGRSVTSIWPHAAWWEEELNGFEQISFAGAPESTGVTWRRA